MALSVAAIDVEALNLLALDGVGIDTGISFSAIIMMARYRATAIANAFATTHSTTAGYAITSESISAQAFFLLPYLSSNLFDLADGYLADGYLAIKGHYFHLSFGSFYKFKSFEAS